MPALAEEIIASDRPNVLALAKSYFELVKPERTLTNVLTAAAGFLLASAWSFNASLLVETLAGTTLIIASACVANNLLDRKIDQKMARTKGRVLVTGLISARAASNFLLALGAAGFALLALVNWLTFWLGALAFISYVFIYGYSKRKTVYSTLIGTLPGGLSLVAGYTAVTDRLDFTVVLLFLVMLAWQMSHFYAIAVFRVSDYKRANLPIWSVKKGLASTKIQILIWIITFTVVTLILAIHLSSWLLAGVMLIANVYWLKASLSGEKNWARASFGASLSVMLVFCLVLAASPII